MTKKVFTLSTDYQRLWTLLHDGATVVYQVEYLPKKVETGLIDKTICSHIPTSLRYTDEDGLRAWNDISLNTFLQECKRLNLQFFDETLAGDSLEAHTITACIRTVESADVPTFIASPDARVGWNMARQTILEGLQARLETLKGTSL